MKNFLFFGNHNIRMFRPEIALAVPLEIKHVFLNHTANDTVLNASLVMSNLADLLSEDPF